MQITAKNNIKQKLFDVARENFSTVSRKLYQDLPEPSMYKVTLSAKNKKEYDANVKPTVNTVSQPYDYSLNEDGTPKMWVSFANKYLGGGFLDEGFVQEEVLTLEFYQMSEMIVKKSIPLMAINEAYIFKNLIRTSVSDPKGYKDYTKAKLAPVKDVQVADFLAIDAPKRKSREAPYEFKELNHLCLKSLCGFSGCAKLGYKEINTGNWGAGVFYNQHTVVYFIQVLSAWLVGIADVTFWMYEDNDDTNTVLDLLDESEDVDEFFTKGMKMLGLGKYTIEKLYSM